MLFGLAALKFVEHSISVLHRFCGRRKVEWTHEWKRPSVHEWDAWRMILVAFEVEEQVGRRGRDADLAYL